MINQKKTANAIGGKTARACESCLKRRAKWFCAADDAFLCHACDLLVHSANGLTSHHHRVCLDNSSTPPQHQHQQTPSWHHGFTKKARTPRKNTNNKATSNKDTCKYNPQMMSVVPEVSNDDEYEDDGVLMLVDEEKNNYKESINDDDDDQMIFSVPDLDDEDISKGFKEEGVFGLKNYNNDGELFNNFSLMDFEGDVYDHDVHGWEFPENELAEFAADVESLLEQEEEDEGAVTNEMIHEQEGEVISANDCDHTYFDWSIDVESDMFTFNLNDNCEENNDEHIKSHHHHHHFHHQQLSGEEEEVGNNGKVVIPIKDEEVEESNNSVEDGSMEGSNKKRRIVLRLNYDDVINAWASQGCSSPWTTGRRPEFGFDHHGWPYCMGDLRPPGFEWRGNAKGGDGGREAKVSRYREKRRTRLFSKKIRYEVRKLNAEKRPRLKGRFVKRTSLSQGVSAESTFPHPRN